ncbi:hypothetical protein ACQKM2_04890 [Streptomyces sp. NPDC004126]|uniref:hypothetical protein n=1 Tax=Streptomyces sp. NPDC004126 TaxID=3390695 RepID=UPI003D04387F
MTLKEGRRVTLTADIGLADALAAADGSGAPPVPVAGFLALAAGTAGTVERVDRVERREGHGVREYARLKSLFDSFGHAMPEGSRRQLEEQLAALEPEWTAHQELGPGVTVRVRFDNGFVLDGTPADLFADAGGDLC